MALQTLDATTVGQHIATAWMEHFAFTLVSVVNC